MGIEALIARMCTQTAVYWGSPVADGYGGKTFDDPVEIKCRWENQVEKISWQGASKLGEEIVSRAQVFTTQDVDELGWLFLGDLDDLDDLVDSSGEADPMAVEGAYEIKRFDKTPAMRSTTEFSRVAYL